jgi:hypothetical protein
MWSKILKIIYLIITLTSLIPLSRRKVGALFFALILSKQFVYSHNPLMNLNRRGSFLLVSLLLDVEVFDLIGILVGGDDIEELSEAVLLEVFLGEILKVTL